MDTQISKGNLNDLKGQIKQTWGKLTDDDLTRLEGGGDELIGKIQKAYGYTRERAMEEFDRFKTSNSNYFRDNRGTNNQENYMASTQYGSGQSLNTRDIKNKATHMMEEDLIEPAQQYMNKAREFGVKAMDRGTEVVKENPGYSILGAAAVGFLAGAYFSRRR